MAKNSVHPSTIAEKHKWGSGGVLKHFLGKTTFHSEAESSLCFRSTTTDCSSTEIPRQQENEQFSSVFSQLFLFEYFILHASCGSKPFCYFSDKPKIFFATEEMLLFSRRWQEFTFAHWCLYPSYFFLLQIENHISDIDNWVKVSFSIIPERIHPSFL